MGTSAGQQKETSADIAQAQHAQNLMTDYEQRWLPVQQKLASTIEQEGQPDSAARKLATGKSSTDTAIAFNQAQSGLEKGLTNAGAAPGSARADLAITGQAGDAAASTGLGKMMSEQQIDDAYTSGLGALTSLGRGEKAMVGSSLTQQAAQSSQQAASDANASLINRGSDAKLAGTAIGFGLQQGMNSFGGGSGMAANDPNGYGMGSGVGGFGPSQLPTAGGR
jgi:hypothetical protein